MARRYIDMEDFIGVGISLVLIVLGCALAAFFASQRCDAQWGRSGMAHEWGPIKGCVVQRPDGTWAPADSIRNLT